MSRRRPVLLGALALAALLVATLAAAPLIVPRLTGNVGSSTPPRSSLPAPTASVAAPVEPGDPAAFAWYRADVATGPDGAVNLYHLVAGTLDEPAASLAIEVPLAPNQIDGMITRPGPAAAPVDGRIVYVADDGRESTIHRVAIADPTDDVVLGRISAAVWSVVVTPDGSEAYLLLLRRDGRGDAGVVRLALDGSGAAELVMDPAAPDAIGRDRDRIVTAAIIRFDAALAMAVDGSLLARRVCAVDGCRTDVLDLATGELRDLGDGDLVGLVARRAIVTGPCADVAPFGCRLAVRDPAGGPDAVLAEGIQGAKMAVVDGRAIVVYGAAIRDFNPTQLRGVDPTNGRDVLLLNAPPGLGFHVGLASPYVPPEGWTVIERSDSTTLGVSLRGAEPIELFIQLDGPGCPPGECVQG